MSEGTRNNPRRVSVRWFKPIPYSDLRDWKGEYYEVLYVVYKGSEILYVGMAYDQYVDIRLGNHHKLSEIAKIENQRGLVISFGELRLKHGRRLSRRLVEEIENLLIFYYEPKYNKRGIYTYTGRELVIRNSGPGNPFDQTVSSLQLD